MTAAKYKVEIAPEGVYPPGEEWRMAIREVIGKLVNIPEDSDQWVKVEGIEPDIVNRARSAAHSRVRRWEGEWQLITRYDPETKTLWLTVQEFYPDEFYSEDEKE